MKNNIYIVLFTFLFLLVQSCATIDKISNEEKVTTPLNLSQTNIYLIGDAGYVDNENQSKVLKALENNIQKATKNDVLLFLGDNIYPKGFNENNAEAAKKSLDQQLQVAKKFKGRVIFIPGNHDWYSGIDGLKLQEKYIENALGKNSFLP